MTDAEDKSGAQLEFVERKEEFGVGRVVGRRKIDEEEEEGRK